MKDLAFQICKNIINSKEAYKTILFLFRNSYMYTLETSAKYDKHKDYSKNEIISLYHQAFNAKTYSYMLQSVFSDIYNSLRDIFSDLSDKEIESIQEQFKENFTDFKFFETLAICFKDTYAKDILKDYRSKTDNVKTQKFLNFAEKQIREQVIKFAKTDLSDKEIDDLAKEITGKIDWESEPLMHKGLSWITKNYLEKWSI